MSHGNRSKLKTELWALRNLVEGSANVLRAFVEKYENAPDDVPLGIGLTNGHFDGAMEMLIRLDSAILDFVEPSRMAPLDRLACVERARLLGEYLAFTDRAPGPSPDSDAWWEKWTARARNVQADWGKPR